jgi:hypothetical protein
VKPSRFAGIPAAAIVAAGAIAAAVLLVPRAGISQAGAPGGSSLAGPPATAPAAPPAIGSAPLPAEPVVPPPLPLGNAPDLDLVFSAQVVGWIEPCG